MTENTSRSDGNGISDGEFLSESGIGMGEVNAKENRSRRGIELTKESERVEGFYFFSAVNAELGRIEDSKRRIDGCKFAASTKRLVEERDVSVVVEAN